MLAHYLKLALRNLVRHKLYSFLNIAGLAIGTACCLLIFLYVRTSLRYDIHHPHHDRTYRLISQSSHEDRESWYSVTAPALTPALNKDFPEVEQAFRLFLAPNMLVEYGQNKFYEDKFFLADAVILQILDLPLRAGDSQTALKDPGSVIISVAMAQKYFGRTDPIGQVITINKNKTKISGVLAAPVNPTHLKLHFLAVIDKQTFGERINSWNWQQFYTYLLLKEGSEPRAFEAKLDHYIQKNIAPITKKDGVVYTLHLQPLKDIYLRSSHLEFDQPERGNINYVYAFAVIAVFILVIACFNFMNLATARSLKRAREVGVRKVIGAYRSQLIRQFLGESMLLTLIAFALAIPIVAFTLPYFNQLSGESLSLDYRSELMLGLGLLLASLPVGLLAGLYPAFFLSAFRPIAVLKSTSASGGYRLSALRQGLVIAQFVISVVLMAATTMVYRQLNFLQQKNLGFNKEQTLVMSVPAVIGLPGEKAKSGYEPFKTELLRNPAILAVSASYGDPGGLVAGDGIELPGHKSQTGISMFTVDYDYIAALKMEVVAGRPFSKNIATDEQQAFILNETAVKDLGFGTPERALGKEIIWDEWLADGLKKKGKVIGVI
ncbi:MAG: FtsX-like permease family protein, partial [Adhaeribacter sp.]|nr:FtsX-like permease family protein [Adhaeribacter sp.]